jgi:hypothetical protein
MGGASCHGHCEAEADGRESGPTIELFCSSTTGFLLEGGCLWSCTGSTGCRTYRSGNDCGATTPLCQLSCWTNCSGEEIEVWTEAEVQTPSMRQQPDNRTSAASGTKCLSMSLSPPRVYPLFLDHRR